MSYLLQSHFCIEQQYNSGKIVPKNMYETKVFLWDGMRFDIPIFEGYDPEGWILEIERYFEIFRLTKEEEVDMASECFEGFVMDWYQWESRLPFYSWRELKSTLVDRFSYANNEIHYDSLPTWHREKYNESYLSTYCSEIINERGEAKSARETKGNSTNENDNRVSGRTWFLAHESDYPSDNEKSSHENVQDTQGKGTIKDEDDLSLMHVEEGKKMEIMTDFEHQKLSFSSKVPHSVDPPSLKITTNQPIMQQKNFEVSSSKDFSTRFPPNSFVLGGLNISYTGEAMVVPNSYVNVRMSNKFVDALHSGDDLSGEDSKIGIQADLFGGQGVDDTQQCNTVDELVLTNSNREATGVIDIKKKDLSCSRKVEPVEFCRMKNVLDEIHFNAFIDECDCMSSRITKRIFPVGKHDQKISSFPLIPGDFFEDVESSWKGHVTLAHIEEAFDEVENAAETFSQALREDFSPLISRLTAVNTLAPCPALSIKVFDEKGGEDTKPTCLEAMPKELAVNDIDGIGNSFMLKGKEITSTNAGKTLWLVRVSGKVTLLAGNANFWAIGCEKRNKDNPLLLECFNFNNNGEHSLFGIVQPSIAVLRKLPISGQGVNFFDRKILKRQLFVTKFYEGVQQAFLDSMVMGCEMNSIVASLEHFALVCEHVGNQTSTEYWLQLCDGWSVDLSTFIGIHHLPNSLYFYDPFALEDVGVLVVRAALGFFREASRESVYRYVFDRGKQKIQFSLLNLEDKVDFRAGGNDTPTLMWRRGIG